MEFVEPTRQAPAAGTIASVAAQLRAPARGAPGRVSARACSNRSIRRGSSTSQQVEFVQMSGARIQPASEPPLPAQSAQVLTSTTSSSTSFKPYGLRRGYAGARALIRPIDWRKLEARVKSSAWHWFDGVSVDVRCAMVPFFQGTGSAHQTCRWFPTASISSRVPTGQAASRCAEQPAVLRRHELIT